MNVLGQRVRKARNAMGLTQAQLASRLHIDQAHISHIERGTKNASMDLIRTIARELHITPAYLLGEQLPEDDAQYESDAVREILNDHETPQGLRDLASNQQLAKTFGITTDEWRTLIAIAASWPEAHLVAHEGWLQVLFALRAVSPKNEMIHAARVGRNSAGGSALCGGNTPR